MHKQVFKSIVLTIALSLAFLSANADVIDDSNEVVSLYEKGKRMMRLENFLEAASIFQQLSARFPNSKNLDLFQFNKAKCDYNFGDFNKAVAGFSYFIKAHRNSNELPAAYFFLGNSYYRNSQVKKALDSYLSAWQIAKDERLKKLIFSSITSTLENSESINLKESYFADIPAAKLCPIVKMLGKIYNDRNEFSKAEEVLALCDEASIDNNNSGNTYSNADFEIAVLLPFSGELNEYGQELYNGTVVALEEIRKKNSRTKINLVPYDTKGDPIEAGRIVKQLCSSGQVDLIVGPLTSQEASVASASLCCSNLPMIIPAATDAGLTQLAENAYQLSPNIELQGTKMAEYAINKLGADTALIITPTSNDHIKMAKAFADRFKKMGGEILSTEYYRPRDKDFGKIIRGVKSLLLRNQPDSIFIIDLTGDTLDFDELEVAIDCIFLPGDAGRLRLLIPQLHFYNLIGFLLGSDSWGNESVLKLEDKMTRNAIFASPFLSAGDSEKYLKFASQYDERYGSKPSRLSSLGYDAIMVALDGGNSRKISAKSVANNLSRRELIRGVSGEIKFGKYNENIEMPLYKIERKQALNIERSNELESEGN